MASPIYLHQHPEFPALLEIVAQARNINDPALVEKDYWIMHCLYGLQQFGLAFELKGGTSLSKGYRLIHRFSEDIDLRIMPPDTFSVETNPKKTKPQHCASRKAFYDWLAQTIQIEGIQEVAREAAFDDEHYRSGGIKLNYGSVVEGVPGLKDGILLEVGFDDVTPNQALTISSWAYDFALTQDLKEPLIDNRAINVRCYHPGYTLVEKLQTVSTKYRQQQSAGDFPKNFLRHYYDIYCLLENAGVQRFIGTAAYQAHKVRRFRQDDEHNLAQNEAFLLRDAATRQVYAAKYQDTRALYYQGQVDFEEILARIQSHASAL